MGRRRLSSPTEDGSLSAARGWYWTLAVVALVVAIGAVATTLLYRQADASASAAEQDLVMRISRVLQDKSKVIEAGFSGATALVRTDGLVNESTFRAWADQLASSAAIGSVGFERIVTADQREAYETSIGRPIREIGSAGGLVAAAGRPWYAPVEWVQPPAPGTQQVVGFDFASEPVRAAVLDQARDTGMTVFSGPGAQQPDNVVAFFVVHALYRPNESLGTVAERRAAFVGAVSAAVTGDWLLQVVAGELPRGARLLIVDGGDVLASTPQPPAGGHHVDVTGGGRPWIVTVDRPGPSHRSALIVWSSSVLAAGLIALFLARNRRQTEELRASATAVRALGILSERLAASDDLGQMGDSVATHAAAMVGAQRAVLAIADDTAPSGLVRAGSGGGPVGNEAQPLLEALGSGRVVIDHPGDLRQRYPDAAAAFAARGVQAVAALALHDPARRPVGVLEFEWRDRPRFRARLTSTLAAAAELCQQHVVRAQVRASGRASAAALSTLGQRLSVARTFDEVATEVVHHAPAASGAAQVVIGFFDPGGTTLRLLRSETDSTGRRRASVFVEVPVDSMSRMVAMLRLGRPVRLASPEEIDDDDALRALIGPDVHRLQIFPLLDSASTLVAIIAFVHGGGSTEPRLRELGRPETIADLTAQTIERASLYQRQHELVLELQRRTLTSLPTIPGVRLAARYLPSSLALGLGGDWYDVQPLGDECTGVVVGDVVGHGIEAIADMTEIRTTVSTLLRTDRHLAEVAARSSELLAAVGSEEVTFATAVLMLVDVGRGSLTYVRAGHPPPVMRTTDGNVILLDRAGTTPIGVVGTPATPARLDLVPGAVIVAYTDGLIERRGEPIDDGIARLVDALAACDLTLGPDPERIAEELIDALLGGRSTEDDTALVVIVVDPPG